MPTVARWLGARPQFLDSNGDPLASGRLFFYLAGTSTKQNSYTSSTGSVANSNPMVLDAAGRPQQMIFFDLSLLYDVKLCAAGSDDPPASAIWTEEDIQVVSGSVTPVFADSTFRISGSDSSKLLAFEVDGLTTGQTRTATMPDYNVRLANLPAGIIMDYAGASIPTGWLECTGAAVSRTTYAALFTAIGTTWGVGDNSTTFNIPDFRGRTTIGKGTGSGLTARSLAATGGEETHILTEAEMPTHDHDTSATGAPMLGSHNGSNNDVTAGAAGSFRGTLTGAAGSDDAHNNMQPFAVVTKIISI